MGLTFIILKFSISPKEYVTIYLHFFYDLTFLFNMPKFLSAFPKCKEPEFVREMADSKSVAEKVQNEPGTSCCARKQGSAHRVWEQVKKAQDPLTKSGTIWVSKWIMTGMGNGPLNNTRIHASIMTGQNQREERERNKEEKERKLFLRVKCQPINTEEMIEL